jgi:hypothetical protein
MQTKERLGGKLLWTPNMVAIGVGLWKYIRRGWRIFLSHTRFDPGDGTRIKFWDDVVRRDMPQDSLPSAV